jgi:hypothetical protein
MCVFAEGEKIARHFNPYNNRAFCGYYIRVCQSFQGHSPRRWKNKQGKCNLNVIENSRHFGIIALWRGGRTDFLCGRFRALRRAKALTPRDIRSTI